MAESLIAMAERHVVEGADRITRQETLIANLIQHGHERMLPGANALLDNLRDAQKASEEHLCRLLAKQKPS